MPFGRGKLVGVVVTIDAETAVGSHRLKQVLRLLDDTALLDPELMQTLAWAADYWLGAPGEAYANALPLALREAKPLPALGDEYWSLSVAGRSVHDAGSRRGGSKTLLALLANGALSAQVKQLIALAVAHTTQCPYCIRGHTEGAVRAGATDEQIMEAIWVAAEMRAGAAYAHSTIALDTLERIRAAV